MAQEDRVVNLGVGRPVEGRVAGEQYVRDDPDGPEVALPVVPAAQDGGTLVVRRSNPIGHGTIARLVYPGQAEVDQPHRRTSVVRLEHYVLGLDVSVHDVPVVEASHRLEQGHDYPRGLVLGEAPTVVSALDDPVEELATGVSLRDDVDVLGVLEAVDHPHDAPVIADRAKELDLSQDVIVSRDLRLAYGLDGAPRARGPVPALVDAAVVPGAEDGRGDVVLICDFALPAVGDRDVATPRGLDADGRDRGRDRGRARGSARGSAGIDGDAPGIPGEEILVGIGHFNLVFVQVVEGAPVADVVGDGVHVGEILCAHLEALTGG